MLFRIKNKTLKHQKKRLVGRDVRKTSKTSIIVKYGNYIIAKINNTYNCYPSRLLVK